MKQRSKWWEKIWQPPPKHTHKYIALIHTKRTCVWGRGALKGALFTVCCPPALHSLSHFKQSYWQGRGSSPCFQCRWSFKAVKGGSSLEATGPRLAHLANAMARWSGHIGKTLAHRPMQMAPDAFLGGESSFSLSLFFSPPNNGYTRICKVRHTSLPHEAKEHRTFKKSPSFLINDLVDGL